MKEVRQEREREEVVEAPVQAEDVSAPFHGYEPKDPAGANPGAPERWATKPADHAAKAAEVEEILAGRGDPKKLPELFAAMDFEYRATMPARMEDVAKIAGGDIVLQLADLCDVNVVEKFGVALGATKPPSVTAIRGHLTVAGPLHITNVLEDEVVGPALQAWFPGPATALLPQLGDVDEMFAQSPPTLEWMTKTMPPAQLAYAFMRGFSEAIGSNLNTLGDGAWAWVDAVDAALVRAFPHAARNYAAEAKDAPKARLDTLLAAVAPDAPVPDVARDAAPTPMTDLEAALGEKPVVVQRVLDAAANHGKASLALVNTPAMRKRILAHATPDEILRLGALIGLPEREHMEWLLDTHGVTPADVALAYNTWDKPLQAFADSSLRDRLRKRWSKDVRPLDVFGGMIETLIEIAVDSPADAAWLFTGASALEILHAATTTPANTTKYCRTLEKSGIGYGWVRELGAGPSDPRLRVLALNCPDAEVAKFVRERLLGDYAGWFKEDDTVADTTAGAYDSGRQRLSIGVSEARLDPAGVVAQDLDTRVAELDPKEVAALRGDPVRLRTVLERAPAADRPRIVFDVEPTLAELVDVTPAEPVLPMVPYLRMRPEGEHVSALGDETVASGLRERFPRNPMALFPVLQQPGKLRKVLRGNSAMVTWILAEAAAGPALHALGHRDVVEAAAEALAEQPAAVKRIPSGEALDPDARRAVEQLRDHAPDDELTKTLTERLDDVAGGRVDEQAQAAERAEGKPLWKALEQLLDSNAPVASLLGVCDQRRHEAGKLFKEAKYDDLVARLAQTTGLSPLVVFNGLPWDGLLYARSARDWLLTFEPPWSILGALAPGEIGVGKLAKLMDDFDDAAINMLSRLPGPAGLKEGETRGLRLLFDGVKSHIAAARLFEVRWGARVDGRYNHAEMGRLWSLMSRLPSAHVEQLAVKEFISDESKKETLGLYGSQGIALYDHLIDEEDQTLYGQDDGVPRAQFMKIHGLTDEQFDAKLGKSVEEMDVEGAKVYRLKAVPVDAFTSVALHEIGHAVDDMMGQRTELAYGLAGWREHANAEFDQWATMLGGWDVVPEPSKKRIREAWQMFLNSSGSIDGLDATVAAMCSAEHPIHDPTLRKVGVVDMAHQPRTGHRDPYYAHGRMWIINHHRKTWLSANEEAMHASPSAYGRSAPAEFFAECYVDYYREYDGTAKTAAKKGGKLAPWIKDWFDTNIDTLTFNPARDKAEETP